MSKGQIEQYDYDDLDSLDKYIGAQIILNDILNNDWNLVMIKRWH